MDNAYSPSRPGRSGLGIRANLSQFVLQLIQVFFVGLTLGMMRTVVPAVAETEFGVPRNDMRLLVMFVVAFGIVKAMMNFVAGAASERLGRKRVLVIGWLVALPIPFMIWYGPTWGWIVASTILLGVNQGLTWSMTITSKLDLTRDEQRGLANGLNEFCGYFAVALAGVITAVLAEKMGPRAGLFAFGLSAIVPALAMAGLFVKDTRVWRTPAPFSPDGSGSPASASASAPAARMKFFAVCQAGLVEKFTDALVWIVIPIHLLRRGVDLADIGWIPFIYGTVWGVSQLFTGPLSDRIGRLKPIVAGMMLCGVGVAMMALHWSFAWWSAAAGITGLGMALLYPTLGAAVSDLAPADQRGKILGVYRFWRDLGYGVGALALGLIGYYSGRLEFGFWFVAVSMFLSAIAFTLIGAETHAHGDPVAKPRSSP